MFAACRAKADEAPINAVANENWTFSYDVYHSLLISCMESNGYGLNPILQVP
jgi:hypothetical protein